MNTFLQLTNPLIFQSYPIDGINPFLYLRDILESRLRKDTQTDNQSIWVIHRIDAETSGLVLLAKTKEMHQRPNKLFETQKIEKTYLAVVSGYPVNAEGTIDLPISQHSTLKRFMQVNEKGKPSLTRYKFIEKFQQYSLLEVYPKTGRTHQIRVHLTSINCPLAIDPLYANTNFIKILDIKTNYRSKSDKTTPSSLINRLTLHPYRIKFKIPNLNKEYQFKAEIPKDFDALIKTLRKYEK